MHLLMVGLNHKTAPLEVREQFVFDGQLSVSTMEFIVRNASVNAVVLVSTCNRTELYLEADSLHAVRDWLLQQRGLKLSDLKRYTYLYSNRKLVRHLMQVACGLDSMVLGEVEILGQLKSAYIESEARGFVSKSMGKLFQSSFAAAKKVRTQTEISLNPVSIASLAVRLVTRIFGRLNESKVLVIGAGDTAQLLVKHLCSAGVQSFVIANRTLSKSKDVAGVIRAGCTVEYIELNMVPKYLPRVDIVITATAAPLPIVGKGMMERAMRVRKQYSMFLLDVSVPRNIEPQVQDLPNVYLYCINDLQAIATEHKKNRSIAALQAEDIIAQEVDHFMQWLQGQDAVSTIHAFRELCAQQRDQALIEALRQLQAGKDPAKVLERLAHVLLNRLIHQPTVQMRNASKHGNLELVATARRLFRLEEKI